MEKEEANSPAFSLGMTGVWDVVCRWQNFFGPQRNCCSELRVFQLTQEERIEQEFEGAVGLGAVLRPEAD